MLKFIFLLSLAVAFAAESDDVTPKSADNPAEIIEKYRDAFLKYSEKSVANLKQSFENVTVSAKDIKFYFYGGPDTTSVVEGTLDDPKFPWYPLFNATFETEMYIHGWLQENDNETNYSLFKKYAYRGHRVNFISVDWSSHSFSIPFYPNVVENIAPKVAEYVYQMLQRLISKGVDEKKVHLMGFGVGAHIAGLAGKRFDKSSKIARITGLSPFGPYYNNKSESERLAKGDADLVDVIHTNMGTLGISQPIGDINFLPQGGRLQPAGGTTPLLKHIISHLVSRKYFNESVEYGYGGFIGRQCDSWYDFTLKKCSWNPTAVMGENVSRNLSGNFFLMVNEKSPYSRGINGLYTY